MADLLGKPASFYAATGGKPVEGAWYSGQRYLNGQLLPAGQYEPGKMTSNEVIAQTNPANVKYIADKTPSTPAELSSGLSNFQSNLFGQINTSPDLKVQSISEIAADLKASGIFPTVAAPTPPNLVQTYTDLATAKGVDAIQASITDLKSQQDAIANQLQVTKTAEQGKPVAMNVIEGRVSQEQQVAQDQYDFIGRQLARKTDEYSAAMTSIKTIMDFTQQDYQNASTSYNTQFDQAISTFNLIHGVQQDQKTDVQRATDNARANLQILTNSITAGNTDYSNLPADTKLMITKLEVQSGLPVGFMSSLKMDPKANILFTNSNEGVTQVGIRNPDGTVSVQSYGTSTKKPTYAAIDEVAIARDALAEVDTNGDKLVSLAEYQKARSSVYSQISDPTKAANALNTATSEYGKWKW